MVTPKQDILCEQAKFYYYDLLFQESNRIIPESITNHFKQCQHCKKQINQLNRALTRAESISSFKQIKSSSEINSMLKLHFAYLNNPVNCEITKPFLPGLLDPVLAIRIPTPITVHLDHCKECANDLKTIQNLDLNRAQLSRLSQLLSDKQTQDKINCKQAQISIIAFVFLAFSEIDEKQLKHLCICPECRKALYQFREATKEELLSNKRNETCSLFDQIPGNEKFDFVVPYGLDPAKGNIIKIQRSLMLHLRRCPICLTKIQELHREIYDISERSESGTVTVYKTIDSYQFQPVNKFDNLYTGYPINVEVTGSRNGVLVEKANSIVNFTAALKQKILSINPKSVVKASFIAAILLIAFTLSLNTSSVKAIDLAQIVSNFENQTNVHISQFSNGKTETTQEQWISNSSNFKIYKTEDMLVLLDLTNNTKITKNPGSDLQESTPLTKDQINDLEYTMQKAFGLILLHDMKNTQNVQWKHISNQNTEEEYELTWNEENYNIFVNYKWSVFTDSKTNLPLKIESYRKISPDGEYEPGTVYIFKYLSDTELSDVKESLFNSAAREDNSFYNRFLFFQQVKTQLLPS